jgi:hypothetical protein
VIGSPAAPSAASSARLWRPAEQLGCARCAGFHTGAGRSRAGRFGLLPFSRLTYVSQVVPQLKLWATLPQSAECCRVG